MTSDKPPQLDSRRRRWRWSRMHWRSASQPPALALNRTAAVKSGRDELVPGAADRHEPLRLGRVALDLPPQVRDVHLAGVLVPDVLARPEVLHELAARDDRVRLLGEEGEHLELGQRQVDAVAVAEHLVPAEVDLEAAELPHD